MVNEKTMSIKIGVMECSIVTDEDRVYVLKIANLVDDKIEEIMNSSAKVSVAVASVLTAMEYCDLYIKAQDSVDNMRSQLRPYIDEAAKTKIERDDLIKENERLRREIETLRARLSHRN